jgi:hypothetical protein
MNEKRRVEFSLARRATLSHSFRSSAIHITSDMTLAVEYFLLCDDSAFSLPQSTQRAVLANSFRRYSGLIRRTAEEAAFRLQIWLQSG